MPRLTAAAFWPAARLGRRRRNGATLPELPGIAALIALTAPPASPLIASTNARVRLAASGSNAAALKGQFQQIKSRNGDLFDGIPGYVAESPDRARLVVGPFRTANDAETFAQDLETVHIDAFRWTNSPTDRIVPLGTE